MGKTLITIPIHKYVPDDATRKLLLQVYDSGNLVQGPTVERFEEMCCDMSGAKYAAAVSNGTVALTLMLRSQDMLDDTLVITNPLSFIATKNAIWHADAIPTFVDVDYETGMLNRAEVVERKGSAHVCIMPVDLHGNRDSIDIPPYWNSPVLRDSSQAHGQKIQDTDTAMSFSFHASKNATCGEGGVIVSDDEDLIREIKILRNHGMNSARSIVLEGAYNARMTDLQAAIGIGSLIKLQSVTTKRQLIARKYNNLLGEGLNPENIKIPLRVPDPNGQMHHYVLRHPKAEKIITILRFKGIDARKYYDKLICDDDEDYDFPNALQICEESFCIPVHEHLTDSEQEYIIESVLEALRFVDDY